MTNQVGIEDLQGLAKSVELNILGLQFNELDAEHRIHVAILSLTALNNSINKAINKLDLPFTEQRELKVHDKIRIVNVDDLELTEFIGEEGWITDIDKTYEYPYNIEFANEGVSNEWLWNAKNLKLI